MPNNWKTYKLSEVVKVIDSLHKTPKYSIEGFPMVRAQDITGGNINLKNVIKVSEDIYNDFSKNHKTKIGDLIFSRVGAHCGKVSFVNTTQLFCLGQNTVFIIPEKANNKFIYFLLSSELIQSELEKTAVVSTYKTISLQTLRNLEINLPVLPEQQSIASILSTIDDKIENNLAINKTLEEMAMALYKHWFVDFRPFQAGEFVESELGMIPKGWEVKTLEYFIEVLSKGTTPRMKDVEGFERKIPFLKVKDISSNGEINLNGLELIPEEIHLKDLKRSILLENDLLFSIAGTIGRVSIVTENLNNSNCNQALAFIRLKEKEKLIAFVYYWLKSEEVQNRIENAVVQGVQANVSLTVLKELEFIKPTNDVFVDFSNKANPILEQVLKNQKENQTLTQLRDTLLPKLISGEVRLKEFRETITN